VAVEPFDMVFRIGIRRGVKLCEIADGPGCAGNVAWMQ
jgi:hypothetical protein